MNCRGCGYPLWNLRARTCPECGEGFLPSEFEFVANSVRFMCPGCGQPYYGTGERGHLVPRKFACVSCGQRVDMDQTVLSPTEGVAEERTRVDALPWAERRKRGFFRAWLATIGMALIKPTRLMHAARETSALSAWWFAVVTHTAVIAAGLVPWVVLFLAMSRAAMPGAVFGLAFPALFFLGAVLVFIAIWGALAHVALLVTGPTGAGIGRTYAAICFASSVNVLAAVPLVGLHLAFLLLPLWWAIVVTLMLTEAQRVRLWRALLAGLLAPLLVYAGIGLLALWAWSQVGTTTAILAATAAAQLSIQTQSLTSAVLSAAPGGEGPKHASALLGSIGPGDMLIPGSGTTKADVPIGTMTLERYFVSPAEERGAALEAAWSRMPERVVAHRWGDFVFTYHGIDLTERDGRLWIVISSPNPDAAAAVQPTQVAIGTADGTIMQMAPHLFPGALAAQNELRAELGLPPLPDPAAVTHDTPALPP